jgi:hypothetical protein
LPRVAARSLLDSWDIRFKRSLLHVFSVTDLVGAAMGATACGVQNDEGAGEGAEALLLETELGNILLRAFDEGWRLETPDESERLSAEQALAIVAAVRHNPSELPRAWVLEQTQRLIGSLGTRLGERSAHPIVLRPDRADELRGLAQTILRLLDEFDVVGASEIP